MLFVMPEKVAGEAAAHLEPLAALLPLVITKARLLRWAGVHAFAQGRCHTGIATTCILSFHAH